MNETFKLYKRLANLYKGDSTTATELALEAKQKVGRKWIKVKPYTNCVPGNVRRTRLVEGTEIVEEYKEDGKYDSIICAKLMTIFEKFINSRINKVRGSYTADDIIYQADLALRYALEQYQPKRLLTRNKKNKVTGEVEQVKEYVDVKFEKAWGVIFDSNINGMFQDGNRLNRKVWHETDSLNNLEDDFNFQVEDPNQEINVNAADTSLLLDICKKNKDIMSYLIVYSCNHNLYLDKDKNYIWKKFDEKVPEEYKDCKINKNVLFKLYKNKVKQVFERKYGNVDEAPIDLRRSYKRVTSNSVMNDMLKNSITNLQNLSREFSFDVSNRDSNTATLSL